MNAWIHLVCLRNIRTIFKPIYQQFIFYNPSRISRSENLSISFWQIPKILLAANTKVNFLASLNLKQTNKFWKLAQFLFGAIMLFSNTRLYVVSSEAFRFLINLYMWQPNLLCRVTLKKITAFENKLFEN